jgi:protocadherin-16/23
MSRKSATDVSGLSFVCVGQVSATDPDCGVNAIVNYTMGDGFSKYREFEVNPSSGEICIGAPLDHEKRSIYEFPILATDRGMHAFVLWLSLICSDTNAPCHGPANDPFVH